MVAYSQEVLDWPFSGSTDCEPLQTDVWGEPHPGSVRRFRQAERFERASRRARERRRRCLAAGRHFQGHYLKPQIVRQNDLTDTTPNRSVLALSPPVYQRLLSVGL